MYGYGVRVESGVWNGRTKSSLIFLKNKKSALWELFFILSFRNGLGTKFPHLVSFLYEISQSPVLKESPHLSLQFMVSQGAALPSLLSTFFYWELSSEGSTPSLRVQIIPSLQVPLSEALNCPSVGMWLHRVKLLHKICWLADGIRR